MKQLILPGLILALVIFAGCGTTTVIRKPVNLGPPSREAKTDPVPSDNGYKPKHGNAEHATYYSASGCGKERWAIKTLTDPAASQVNLIPQDSTVADLVSIAPPVEPTDRVAPTETTTFRISGTLTFMKSEADSDYHMVIEDLAGNTMIVESPSPSCAQGSLVLSQLERVRQTLDRAYPEVTQGQVLKPNVTVTVTGIGFYDRLHGQTGVAPNGIELHPLLSVQLGGSSSAPSVKLKLSASD